MIHDPGIIGGSTGSAYSRPYDPEEVDQSYWGGYPRTRNYREGRSNYPAYQQNEKIGSSASEGPRNANFDALVGRAPRESVRNAVYDIWGNLIGGKDLAGDQVRDRMPMSGVDRFKLANEAGWAESRGIDPNQIPDEWRLTPNIDRYQKQFRDQPQMTSWGKRWEDAVSAAKNQDNVRDQYHAERLAQYHDFQRALAERRAERERGGSEQDDSGGYGYGYSGGYGRGGGYGGINYGGSGGGGSSYSIGGGGIRGGSTGSAYS